MSIVAFFHKTIRHLEHEAVLRGRFSGHIKHIQAHVPLSSLEICDKCEEFFEESELKRHKVTKEMLCSNCLDLLRIYRGEA